MQRRDVLPIGKCSARAILMQRRQREAPHEATESAGARRSPEAQRPRLRVTPRDDQ